MLAAAAAVAVVGRAPEIGRDTAVAVVVTTLFGLGVVLALSPSSPPGLDNLLFGDLLGVSNADLVLAGCLAAGSLAVLAAMYRPLLALGFDRGSAHALGIRSVAVDLVLLALLAVAILIGVQGLGNLLVLALLIAPAATARTIARRMPAAMWIAALVAVGDALGGLYLSYYASLAAGASVAAVAVAAFVLAFSLRPPPGLARSGA